MNRIDAWGFVWVGPFPLDGVLPVETFGVSTSGFRKVRALDWLGFEPAETLGVTTSDGTW